MTARTLDRLVAAGLFLFALVLYLLTVAPTASFWDPGERIAAAYGLQIPHPPGAPLYMLIGRVFSMFAPAAQVAVAVNLVSVVASAFTVLLTFLIIRRLAGEWKGPRETWSPADRLSVHGGALIGALALAVSDAFWFNALEAETYALSTFFTALCVWLTLRWLEQARHQDALLAAGKQHVFGSAAERWLIAIAYLYGLAIGVHLLSLLSIFFAALIIYFQHFERPEWAPGRRLLGLAAAAGVSVLVFALIYPGIIQWLPTAARDSGAPGFFVFAIFAFIVFGLYYTHKQRYHIPNMLMLFITVVMIGYSSYALIVIRSVANPPMDQNDPETFDAFVSYMAREQYGATPLLTGPAFDNRLGRIDDSRDRLFPRRWSPMPEHERVYAQYGSDWDYFWSYQINYMYLRYFMWQWAGRASDRQGANWTAGILQAADMDPPARSPSERNGRNIYYGIPFLLGLFGLGFHFARDWRRALAVGVLFFFTGLGIVLYLNQTPLQPRERDYSYAGSFFAFSLWIGLGAVGMIELATTLLRDRAAEMRKQLFAGGAVMALLLLLVPGIMLQQNYGSHDRSGRYVAPDFAWNMLHSVEENAVIFTNGDNDTFPLWYLQEVEGVRRDVRVVNLSLLQTSWYIRQLRNQWSRDSAPIPMTYSDQDLDRIRPELWEPQTIELPLRNVDPELAAAWGVQGGLPETFRWQFEGRPYAETMNVVYANDLVILSILAANAADGWSRPIYFATTTGFDGQVGLGPYLQLEGLALRVTPVRSEGRGERINPSIALRNLEQFRFRNLDDPNVYFDENKRSMVDNYRSAVFGPIARQLAAGGYDREARALLETARREVPFETVPPSFVSIYMLAEAYTELGDSERVIELMELAEPIVVRQLDRAVGERAVEIAAQYVQTVQSFYLENRAFEQAAAFSDRIALAIGDPRYRRSAEEFRQLMEGQDLTRQETEPEVVAPPDQAETLAEPEPGPQTVPLP